MANRIHSSQRDIFTGFTVVTQNDHSYIHDGIGFTISGETASIAAGASYHISFQTPKTGYVHFRPVGFSSTANIAQFYISEGSTFSAGTTVVPYNRNRNSSRACSCVIKTGVTMTAEGTQKMEYATAGIGGTSSRSGGNGDGSAEEIVFDQDTVYTLTFKNIGSSTATVVNYKLFWYEESMG